MSDKLRLIFKIKDIFNLGPSPFIAVHKNKTNHD